MCPWQALAAQFIVCGQGLEPTLEWSIWKVLQQGELLLYQQRLEKAGKASQGQTL